MKILFLTYSVILLCVSAKMNAQILFDRKFPTPDSDVAKYLRPASSGFLLKTGFSLTVIQGAGPTGSVKFPTLKQ